MMINMIILLNAKLFFNFYRFNNECYFQFCIIKSIIFMYSKLTQIKYTIKIFDQNRFFVLIVQATVN